MIRRPRVLAALFVAGFVGITQAQTTWYVDDDAPNDLGPGDPSVSDPNSALISGQTASDETRKGPISVRAREPPWR